MNNSVNSDINIIGGIPDYNIIYEVLHLLAQNVPLGAIHESIVSNNKFGIRTEKARGRFLDVIRSAFWQFNNKEHEILIGSLYKSAGFEKTKRYALFWMLVINNTLFENITKQVFVKAYFSGRVQIKNDEIVAYLRHERETNPVIQKWADTTIETIASKYLTFLKKIDFLKGRQKKEFKYIQVDHNSLIYFLYLIKAVKPNQPDIFKSRYIDFLIIEITSLINTLKKATFAEFFDLQTTGADLKIDLKFDYGEIIDAISSRT